MPIRPHVDPPGIARTKRGQTTRRSMWPGARPISLVAIAGALLTGCRADSFTAPHADDCTGEPGCRTTPTAPVDPIVLVSLEDARLRLAPSIEHTSSQQSALASSLNLLAQALENGNATDARLALADVYEQAARFRITRDDGVTIDPPDVAALRLALVPAANALGVQAR